MSEGEKDGRFMQWLIDRGVVAKTDGSENPGEWRHFERQDWQAKNDTDALDRLTNDDSEQGDSEQGSTDNSKS